MPTTLVKKLGQAFKNQASGLAGLLPYFIRAQLVGPCLGLFHP